MESSGTSEETGSHSHEKEDAEVKSFFENAPPLQDKEVYTTRLSHFVDHHKEISDVCDLSIISVRVTEGQLQPSTFSKQVML